VAAKRIAKSAKLSPPRLLQALPRERLFALLDTHRANAGVWLGGPPGAGKTMLVASWLQSRSLPFAWYRLDTDDNDIGRFFGMLGEAVGAAGIRAKLPIFSADHLVHPDTYARRWFRALCAALPRPFVLVFDNVEQANLAQLPLLLAIALEEAPEHVTLVITSRREPPPALAKAQLAGALAVPPPAALNFTAQEAALYAEALGLDAPAVQRAAARVDGWAAGLRLLSHAPSAAGDDPPPRLLFDYFAGLLHDGLAPRGQRVVLVGALLPWLPAGLVATVAEVPDAAEHLERLCAQNLFTERAGPGVYRLHPLFRDFLLDRGRRTLAAAERAALLTHASRLFLASGHPDTAIDLAFDGGDAGAAADQWLGALEHKLAQGRLDQLAAWYARFPPALLRERPHLVYGRARVCFLREDTAAPAYYESACAAFELRGDLLGQQLCAAGVLEWSYNTDSFIGHQRWCELVRRPQHESTADPAHALRLLNGRLLALFFEGDIGGEAAAWVDRVLALLQPGSFENDKLSVAITLLGCLERDKRWRDAELLAGRMEAMLGSAGIGPRLKILVSQQLAADLHRQTGNYAEARRLASISLRQARDLGFGVLIFEALAILLLAALYLGDAAESERLLGELLARVEPGNIYHQRFSRQMLAWHELQRARLAAAREHAEALGAAVERSDMPARFRATWLLMAVFVRFADGHEAAACAELAALSEHAEAGSRDTLRANLLALQAWQHLHAGRPAEAQRSLAEAFARCAPTRYYQLLAPLRTMLAELAAFALERGVAPDFARELIRRRQLAPPVSATECWPWALRIRTLGRFAVEVDGVPLVFAGKVPKKPLALLKALIAFGGQSVPQHRLIDALWFDEQADAAGDAFNVALHRLRKLLPGGNEAIQLHDGLLSLNAESCWVDAWAFERLAGSATQPPDTTTNDVSAHPALALYAGHFLANDLDPPWSLPTRERLHGRFNQMVVRCANALAGEGRHEAALACWRHGIEIDESNEAFYQGLMQCALALGRPAEGLAAYQQLRRALAMLLGAAPSARSEALHQQLKG
jgi:LuxR family transcriptional regulator, maltose regulon positive regulatory protein